MTFHTETTLAGYARTAVHLKTRMAEYTIGAVALDYLRASLASNVVPALREQYEPTDATDAVDKLVDAIGRATRAAWTDGETFVLAPAMTAIVAAAAEALDLTGDLLTADAAPCDGGVLFLPEPIYHRRPTGTVAGIGAITWTPCSAPSGRFWLICAWSPRDDPDDPNAAEIRRDLARNPTLRSSLGPYLLADLNYLPIAQPVAAPPAPEPVDDASLDWQSTPDGRYVITDTTARSHVVAAIAYAFWRIQAQPIAVAAPAPLDRAARRRAARAAIVHTTRVVMLRRTSPVADRGDGEAKWHYRVRFVVRGHWRRLVDKHGQSYRIWINAHIKGPDGAPLLHGEKVAILANPTPCPARTRGRAAHRTGSTTPGPTASQRRCAAHRLGDTPEPRTHTTRTHAPTHRRREPAVTDPAITDQATTDHDYPSELTDVLAATWRQRLGCEPPADWLAHAGAAVDTRTAADPHPQPRRPPGRPDRTEHPAGTDPAA